MTAEELLDKANAAKERGDFDAAIQALTALVGTEIRHADGRLLGAAELGAAFMELARCYAHAGMFEKAYAAYEYALNGAPLSAQLDCRFAITRAQSELCFRMDDIVLGIVLGVEALAEEAQLMHRDGRYEELGRLIAEADERVDALLQDSVGDDKHQAVLNAFRRHIGFMQDLDFGEMEHDLAQVFGEGGLLVLNGPTPGRK